MSRMMVSIRAVSDFKKLLESESVWNKLVNKWSKNPIFLTGFVKQFMEFYLTKGWTPLVLVISADDVLVGIAPLKMRKRFGVQFAKFLLKSWFSPDFIVHDRHRETSIALTLDFLFKNLRCQFVELTLSADSPNLRILEQKCKDNRISFFTTPDIGHRVTPVKFTWNEFKASRGRKFRRRFKEIERKLDQAGSWRVTCVENENEDSDVLKRILDVEKSSWKQMWRTRRGIKLDQDLLMIWKGSQYAAKIEPDFKWSVWFLELNEQPLAYTLVLQYKGVAFVMKTSYNQQYAKFSPGKYINNAAVSELLNKRQVRNIDWLTDPPFVKTWASICLPRVRVMMLRKGPLPAILGSVLTSEYTRNILKEFPDWLIEKMPFIGESA